MSHVVNIDMQIKATQLDELKAAVEALGGELVLGQTSFAWWGHEVGDYNDPRVADMKARGIKPGQCDHVIRLKNRTAGDWEIGLVKTADGTAYEPVYDFFGSRGARLEQAFGSRLGRLKDHMGAEIALRHARRAGQRARKTVEADGAVVVEIEV